MCCFYNYNLGLTQIIVQKKVLWFYKDGAFLRFILPKGSIWYQKKNINYHCWLFRFRREAKSFFKLLCGYSIWFHKIFFLKFRMRGLGYRFRKINYLFYRFYFTKTNYIYFHCPPQIRLFSRKRRIILLSKDRNMLHSVFALIMRLHKAGPYNRRGFVYPRRIFRKKPGKKII